MSKEENLGGENPLDCIKINIYDSRLISYLGTAIPAEHVNISQSGPQSSLWNRS